MVKRKRPWEEEEEDYDSMVERTKDCKEEVMREMSMKLRSKLTTDGESMKEAKRKTAKFLKLWQQEHEKLVSSPHQPEESAFPFNAHKPSLPRDLPVPGLAPLPDDIKQLRNQWHFPLDEEDDDTDEGYDVFTPSATICCAHSTE